MRSALSFASGCVVVLLWAACSSVNEAAQDPGNTFCFGCHSETSALGKKILWAQAGWEESVHAKGQVGRIYVELPAEGACPPFIQPTAATCTGNGGKFSGTGKICTMPRGTTPTACTAAGGTYADAVPDQIAQGACPPFGQAVSSGKTACALVFGDPAYASTTCTPTVPAGATYVTQNACESAGGAWVGPRWVLAGEEKEGSNSFYATSGGCQMCHTHEGFRRRIAGEYDTSQYSIRYSWDTRAQVGSPSSPAGQNTPLTADAILNPSPIGCFSCHNPHSVGTADGQHLDQSIPVGTVITTQSGGVWGANKAKGHLCAECHQIRQNANASTIAGILFNATTVGTTATGYKVSATYGTHHGPQTDMLLGTGAADYAGSATSLVFAGTYANSPHTASRNADCISCHMQSDFEDINLTGSFSVSPAVGGHSFTNKGIVHGVEKVLAIGCGSVTDTIGCHTVSGVTGSTGNIVQAANVGQTSGYLQSGDAYFQKSNSATSMVDSNYQFKVNELLTKLANPSASCFGLLDQAAIAAGGKHSWLLMADGFTVDPRCISNGTTTNIAQAAAPADDNTNPSVRFLKAYWNFKFLLEDKSFGVHNTRFALQHLYDSCGDLAMLTGKDCGPNAGAGRCSYCEGPFVTTRP